MIPAQRQGGPIALVLTLQLVLCCAVSAQLATYSYDSLNRLTGVVYSNGTRVVYTYDAAGNRLSMTVCQLQLGATSATFTGVGGEGTVDVVANTGCEWTAIANDPFLGVTSGSSSSGSGSVSYTVAQNTTGLTRTGTLTVAGQTYTVTQSADFAPTITAHPSNATVVSGANATFTVAASGSPAPAYQWQKSIGGDAFSNLTEAPPYSNVTTATLTVAATAELNGAQYRAVATNTLAPPATSNAATLTVHFAPAITTQPSNAIAVSGASATFTVAATGNPAPSYQWQVSIDGGSFTNLVEAAPYSNVTTATLNVAASQSLDGARYRALATNAISPPAASDAATLTVHFAPAITTHPSNVTAVSGTTATFTAAASGNPAPAYQWQVSIGEAAFTNLTEGAPYSNVSTATLTVGASPSLNGARYRAVATNAIVPAATSNAATLTVHFAPAITTHPSNASAVSGSSTTFTVAANGNPAPTYQWQVSNGDGTFTDLIEAAPYANVATATLTVTAAVGLNGKQYRAVATNAVSPPATSNAATLTVTLPAGSDRWVDAFDGNDDNAGSSSSPLKTISKALTVVGANGTIHVHAGTYDTALGETFPITVPSGVKLQSTGGAAATIIDATGANTRVLYLTANSTDTLVEGFTITGGLFTQPADGRNAYGGGILAENDDRTTISRCIIAGNEVRGYDATGGDSVSGGAAYGGGISIHGQTKLINCAIRNNTVRGGNGLTRLTAGNGGDGGQARGGALWASGSAAGQPVITNCTFNANQTIGGNGGTATVSGAGGNGGAASYAIDAASATIVNNIVTNNVLSGGFGGNPGGSLGPANAGGVNASSGTNNLFFNNSGGNGFTGTAPLIATDPLYDNPPADLHLRPSSPAQLAGTSDGAPAEDLDNNPRRVPPTIGAYEVGLFLTATGGIGRITLTWPGLQDVTAYNLYFSGSPGVTTASTKIAAAVSPYVIAPLANSATYFFRIAAIQNGTEGPLSPEVSATTSNGSWVRGALVDGGIAFTNVTRDLADGTVLYATANDSKGLYRSNDGGDSWTAVLGPYNGQQLRAAAANGATVLAAGHGAIYRSADAGNVWSTPVSGAGIGEETINSIAIDPLAGSNVYAGDFHIDGGSDFSDLIAKSVNGGVSFSNLTDATVHDVHAHFLQIDPSVAGTLYAAGSGTPNIARSTNGGSTWGSVSPGSGTPTALALAPNATLYAGLLDTDAITSLGVFRTTNSGASWAAVNAGFPVNPPLITSLLVDGNHPTRVHAGTSVGHYVSLDQGANWATGPAGSRRVVLNALAQSSTRRLVGTAADGIWILPLDGAPSISGVSPSVGGTSGGTAVTVAGSGFTIGSGLRVLFGGVEGTVHLDTSNSGAISVSSPAQPSGTVDLTVINPDGQSAIQTGAFTFSACSYSISPTSANHTSSASSGIIQVTALSGCSWTATAPGGSFVTITGGSAGSGNGTVQYSVDGNTTASSRAVTLTVAGLPFTVDQTAAGGPAMVMSATASTGSVSVAWSVLEGATSYEVRRSHNGDPFSVLTATGALTYTDNTVSNGTAYLYQVHALAVGGAIGSSNVDLAVPFAYTNPSLAIGGVIRAADFIELRQAVTTARAAVGLSAFSFSGSIIAGARVQLVHLEELRSNIDAVRAAVGLLPLTLTDSSVSTFTIIKAAHIIELRNGLK